MSSRRDFLKRLTAGSAGAAVVGCGPVDGGKLIPCLVPPDDSVPGVADWYATVCRECSSGCGVLARVREGRVVKLEGNPEHPLNQGALCPRGQAGLQGLYDPDRIQGPLLRREGGLEPVSWEVALEHLQLITGDGPVCWIGHRVTGTLDALVDELVASRPGSERVTFEPLDDRAAGVAWARISGRFVVPSLEIGDSDLIVSFGADFLETWAGNVAMTRQFARARTPAGARRCRFVHIAPRRGLTGDNADEWIAPEAGKVAVVAAALSQAVAARLGNRLDPTVRESLTGWLGTADRGPAAVAAGVSAVQLGRLADALVAADNPIVLGGGHALAVPDATDLETAVALIDVMLGAVGRTVHLDRPQVRGRTSSHADLVAALARARDGGFAAVLLHHANPVHALPAPAAAAAALAAATVVSFATLLDDSTHLADLVLPDHAPLESWGDHEGVAGNVGLQQPVMRPLGDTRATGDLVSLLLHGDGGESMDDAVRRRWDSLHAATGAGGRAADFWEDSLRRGGAFLKAPEAGQSPALVAPAGALPDSAPVMTGPSDGLPLLVFPTIQLHDGRGANRAWLQEAPDPVTKVTWGSWVELHPDTAVELGFSDGDLIRVEAAPAFEAPLVTSAGIRRGAVGVPLGQGHQRLGRVAGGRGVNPVASLPLRFDDASGSIARLTSRVRLTRVGTRPAVRTQLELSDHDRGIARFVTLPVGAALSDDHAEADFYGDHEHPEHRWGMSIDLNACVGCGACEIACSAENNIAVAGPDAVAGGREMSWIRIDRFESDEGTAFVPMLCQHCDNAPCETVCPVNATMHTPEGLNAMVYNRCVGTRYCSNNCPYKVRRFNWKPARWEAPLELQLNPDVTPRSVGVMEKCSFCVQRIRGAERDARLQGRDLADGEFTTACAQTCPAEAIRFGDLLDRDSRAAAGARDPRAYRIFAELNTKPAISYLARTRLGDE